jgi:acyl-CoA thioesterase-1
MKLPTFLALALCTSTAFVLADTKPAAAAPKKRAPSPVLAPIEDQPGLPRVLLIGDSISMGYTLDVRKRLEGQANVHRIPANGGPTPNGVANLKPWLGDKKWDVIHFNWGLHDLKFIVGEDKSKLVPAETPGAKHQVPLADYEKNLAQLVSEMKATGAKLIWCSTTPVVAETPGRQTEDVLKYNEAAARVMKAAGVATDDLYAYALPRLGDGNQLPKNVHFSPAGSKMLAEKVAAEITAALPKK